MMLTRFAACCMLALCCATASATASPDAAQLLQKGRQTYDGLRDYTCLLASQELVGGKLKKQDGLRLMFMKPASYRMRWSNDWVELYYVRGQNADQMILQGGQLLGWLRLSLPLSAALQYSRHTLVEANIGHTLTLVEKNYRQALLDKDASILAEGIEVIDGEPTWRFKGVFPPDRGYYGHEVRVNLHQENGLPVKIEVRGWQNELLEQYAFSKLRFNVGLTAADFGGTKPALESNAHER